MAATVYLAGHGESALGRKDWSIAAYGGDGAAVVKKLDLTRVILIGHSMGGDVIAEAARQLLGRVAGMIFVDVYKQLGSGRRPESVQSRQMPHTLDELKLPVIAITPDNAPTDVPSMRQHGVEVVIMPGVGHFSFLENPERFNGLLRSAIVKLAQ